MMDIEVASVDEARSGHSSAAMRSQRAVGHSPRLVGAEWITAALRPIIEEVIAICEAKQADYEVNPKKLHDGDGIEANRNSFRVLFDKVITVIALSQEMMPIGLIREPQLIYAKVDECYGDFARQILSGFLFLRFLLPAFTVPKIVGLSDLIPDSPRHALVTLGPESAFCGR
jgi:neurofibromin 1